jgi:hypothetical protein
VLGVGDLNRGVVKIRRTLRGDKRFPPLPFATRDPQPHARQNSASPFYVYPGAISDRFSKPDDRDRSGL